MSGEETVSGSMLEYHAEQIGIGYDQLLWNAQKDGIITDQNGSFIGGKVHRQFHLSGDLRDFLVYAERLSLRLGGDE